MKKFILCLLLLMAGCSPVLATESKPDQIFENNFSKITNRINVAESRLTTLETKTADNIYQNILEKTNQQLGMWTNPYGIMVSVLGVFFAILAIVATVVIYRQGRDYQRKLKNDREIYQSKFDDFLKSQKKRADKVGEQAKDIIKKVDEIAKEYNKKLSTATEEQKEEIKKAIDDLNRQKISIEVAAFSTSALLTDFSACSTSASVSATDRPETRFHKCSKCGFGFMVKVKPLRAWK